MLRVKKRVSDERSYRTSSDLFLIISERELTFTFAICYRRSVCLSVCSWRGCALLSRLKFSAMFLRRLVPWPSTDIQEKFYGDRPSGTRSSGGLNARG